MEKRNIIWPLAIVAVLGSPSAAAVKLSFGFPIKLSAVSCLNLPSCGASQPHPGNIFITLKFDDPFISQSWEYALIGVAYGVVAPFPIVGPPIGSGTTLTFTAECTLESLYLCGPANKLALIERF